MSDFGDLVLVIGDYHVPQRCKGLPECFKELLQTDKIRTVLCTGNLGSKSALESLSQIGQDLHVVRGETDSKASLGREFPESLVIQIGAFKVGLLSGYQIIPWDNEHALQQMQRKLNCDILVSGHTHVARYWTSPTGFLFLNPGSATGAPSPYLNSFAKLMAQRTSVGAVASNDVLGGGSSSGAGGGDEGVAAGVAAPSSLNSSLVPQNDRAATTVDLGHEGAVDPSVVAGMVGGDQQHPGATSSEVEQVQGASIVTGVVGGAPPTTPVTMEAPPATLNSDDLLGGFGGEDMLAGAGTTLPPPAVGEGTVVPDLLDTEAPAPVDRPQFDGAHEMAPNDFAEDGASSARDETKVIPSFMLLAVQGPRVVVYIYREIDGETNVDQFEHEKIVM